MRPLVDGELPRATASRHIGRLYCSEPAGAAFRGAPPRPGGGSDEGRAPDGDPLETFAPAWYAELSDGQQIVRLDLKRKAGRAELDRLFDGADVFLTAQRPDALERLGLGWARLHAHFPRLSHIAIVGRRSPDAHRPGHDLNYVASRGLAIPPDLPRTLVADIGGAEAAVSATLAALVNRERTGEGSHVEVALTEAVDRFAAPFRHGLTRPGGLLAGGYAGYGLYEARDGWVSVAALEPHFRRRLCDELGLPELSHESLAGCFRTRSADAWDNGLPSATYRSRRSWACKRESLRSRRRSERVFEDARDSLA